MSNINFNETSTENVGNVARSTVFEVLPPPLPLNLQILTQFSKQDDFLRFNSYSDNCHVTVYLNSVLKSRDNCH